MASSLIGFRHPQFSEDVAWLPAWLQPPLTNIDMIEGHSPSLQGLENIDTNIYGNSSSVDDGIYKSCSLFLSGEDNSQMTFSSANALHFHLHLSLTGNSENAANLDRSQNGLYSDHPPAVQKLETSLKTEAKHQCLKTANDASEDNFFPISQKENSKIIDPKSLLVNKGTKLEGNARSLKVAGINDSIELSIAASEALIIHEFIKSELTTQQLPTSSTLEVALKVKQARLDGFRDTISHTIEEVTEIDLLSDLDESTMVDAYEDVGLYIPNNSDPPFSGSILSHVKDTYDSENYTSCEEHIYRQPGVPEVCCNEMNHETQLKDNDNIGITWETNAGLDCDNDDRNEHIEDATLEYETVNLACDVDPSLQWSVDVPDTLLSTEKVEVGRRDMTSFQADARFSSQARKSEIAGKDDKIESVVPKFQSRWFGGWTWKVIPFGTKNSEKSGHSFWDGGSIFLEDSFEEEVNTSTPLVHRSSRNIPQPFGGETSFLSESTNIGPDKKQVNASTPLDHRTLRNIPQLFGGETSFLSESADFAPDENSFVQKLDKRYAIGSQSSIAANRVRTDDSQEILLSKDVVMISSPSFMDPFCSAVPCSFALENAPSPVAVQSHMDQVGSTKPFSPLLEPVMDDGKRTIHQCTEFDHAERLAIPGINNNDDAPGICMDSSKTDINGRDRSSPMKCKLKLHSVRQTPAIDMANKSNSCGNKHSLEESKGFQKAQSDCKKPSSTLVPRRKRVRFSETEINLELINKTQRQQTTDKNCSVTRKSKRLKCIYAESETRAQEVKKCSKRRHVEDRKRLIFQNMDFLLTGFSTAKKKEIEGIIMKYGGMVLSEIPSPISRGKRSSRIKSPSPPVILCIRKLQTTKFLYGCAVNACILKVDWLADSIAVGSVLPPKKYMILPNHAGGKCTEIGKRVLTNNLIFDSVGIMLLGKHKFCTKVAEVVKHGSGKVFKTLHSLVQNLDARKISIGAIVTEDENSVSRHLKKCASEQKIHVMPFKWIIDSLYIGTLVPSREKDDRSSISELMHMVAPDSFELSEEI